MVVSENIPLEIRPVLHEITHGMELKKCRKCGCMKDALDGAARAFGSSDNADIQALRPAVGAYQDRMEPLAYDCIGCKKCWGADATTGQALHRPLMR